MGKMTFNIKSFALKWFYFSCSGSIVIYAEYCHLFMKQLGLTPQQIGFTTFLGIPHLLIPLCLLLGDKFRARMLVLLVTAFGMIVTFVLPLLPLVVSLPTCFGTDIASNISHEDIFTAQLARNNGSMASIMYGNASAVILTISAKPKSTGVPWLSNLFILMTVTRSLNTAFDRVAASLGNLATITYLGEERANFGSYYMWSQIGGGISIFVVSLLAWKIKINICGNEVYGFFVAYIWGGVLLLLSLFSFPWFKFEYKTNDTFHWTDIKAVLFKSHHIFMFILLFYIGLCTTFQIYWEFWYLDELSASPLIMGGAGLTRRPLFAVSMFISCRILRRIGELNTICVALVMYALSFLALSFTRIPWLVLGIDIFQAVACGLSYSAFAVHLSKAGSKNCSGIILALMEMCFAVGFDVGAMLMGSLFNAIGTQKTLFAYSVSTAVVLIILLSYTRYSQQANNYEKLQQHSDDED